VLTDQRNRFEIDDQVVYLNSAALSPLLRSVRVAGEQGLARRARPWTIRASDWFTDVERLRGLAGELLASDADHIAVVPATSYGLAVAARNLPAGPGQRVVVLAGEFPSSFHTWQRFTDRTGAELVLVEREPGQSWTEAVIAAVDDRAAIVVAPNVFWTNGALLDLAAVADATHAAGAALVVDASQSFGALPLDVSTLRPDFLVSVGYKWLLGPVGVSFLYVDERHHGGEPIEENWVTRLGADDFAGLNDYADDYQPGARRFDVGQRSNFGSVPMALAGLEQVQAWGPAAIGEALGVVTTGIADRVAALGLTVAEAGARAPHILGLELPAGTAGPVSAALHDRGVVVSVRGPDLRVSPHLHTHDADVDRLVDALAAAL
jgi:selenocysteine lyase/cysteine desulfurase